MRLHSIEFRGLTRFTDPVLINFDALGPGLVAIVGGNGAGKTTVMEAAPASLWKSFPTRPGSLYDHCQGRDAYINTTWVEGDATFQVRLSIDAEARKTEGYVVRDGEPVTDGKAGGFALTVDTLFGSSQLFMASVFAAQDKSGNFLAMKRADRKGLFIDLLGLALLEALAGAARAHGSDEETEMTVSRRILSELPEVCIESVQINLDMAKRVAQDAEEQLDVARKTEADAIANVEQARSASGRIDSLRETERARLATLEAAKDRRASADAAPERIRKQAAELRRQIEAGGSNRAEPEARQRYDEARADLSRRADRLRAGQALKAEPGEGKRALEAIDAELQTIRNAEAARQIRIRELAVAQADASSARQRVRDAAADRQHRIDELEQRSTLRERVPCTKTPVWQPVEEGEPEPLASICPLLVDANKAADELVRLKAGETVEQKAAEAAFANADAVVNEHTEWLEQDDEQARIARAAQLQVDNQAANEWIAAEERASRATAELEEIEAQSFDLGKKLQRELDAARARVEADRKRLEEIDAEELKELDDANAAIAEAAHAQEDAQAEYNGIRAELDQALRNLPDVDAAERAVSTARTIREEAERAQRAADAEVSSKQSELDAALTVAKKRTAVELRLESALREIGDWRLLSDALGKTGAQALEVDAAGPEVAELTNSLLESCWGARFSIRFDTLQEKRSGDGYKEVFDVTVFDRGQPRQVEALSGGERVIIAEAVSLALAIYNTRKNDIRFETLWRDETAGALDPENAQAYIAMLRRACELGGYRQCIFVAHLPAVYEAADVRLVVQDGEVVTDSESVAA